MACDRPGSAQAAVPRRLTAGALPACLSQLPEPPSELFLCGQLPRGPSVALVGTRNPTRPAAEFAFQLAHSLAERGIAVLSGGALGIDSQAHEGALAAGGHSVVVAPSSWDRPYPQSNADLFARVLSAGGGHLSAYESGMAAHNAQFFARNSYLVALCDVVVVVEAPFRSGARNAAQWARRLGRPLLVVPSAPWNPRGVGCIVELKLGAEPLYSHRDVLACLSRIGRPGLPLPAPAMSDSVPKARPRASRRSGSVSRSVVRVAPGALPTDPLAQCVLQAVTLGACYPDQIAAEVGRDSREVNRCLLALSLDGLLVAHPTGAYTLAGR